MDHPLHHGGAPGAQRYGGNQQCQRKQDDSAHRKAEFKIKAQYQSSDRHGRDCKANGSERRAYREIGEFERDLTDHGIVLVKFWLHIDRDEQHKRFRQRETTSFKRWKISQDDWRNRARWDDYETAANEMFERTSTAAAPWHLVEANSKPFARLKVIRTLCDVWEARLKD